LARSATGAPREVIVNNGRSASREAGRPTMMIGQRRTNGPANGARQMSGQQRQPMQRTAERPANGPRPY
jgi:hypothetical protein